MYQEKRSAPRAPADIEIEIYCPSERIYIGKGKLLNISSGGLSFLSEEIFPLGTHLLLKFILWQKFLILLTGEIIWAKREKEFHRYGIKFVQVEVLEKERIRKYVHTELGKEKYTL